MSLDAAIEYAALIESAERMVREHYDHSALRAVLANGPGWSAERWQAFAALGWLAAPLAEDAGGLGLPPSAISALVTALGPAAMSEPLPAQLAFGACLLGAAPPSVCRDALIERFLTGDALVALVAPAAPAALLARREGAGVRLEGQAAGVVDGGIADVLIVVATQPEGGMACHLVAADAAGVTRHARRAIDGRNFADIVLSEVLVAADTELALDAAAIARAQTLFALLLSSETLGIMQALVTITGTYLNQRKQFGRNLLDFQVLQHRLVDMQLEVVRAESMLILARHTGDVQGLAAAAPIVDAAYYQAAHSGRRVAEEAVQLHGAIGMTEELVVGHYFKRVVANGLIAGHAEQRLAQAARARGIFPPIE